MLSAFSLFHVPLMTKPAAGLLLNSEVSLVPTNLSEDITVFIALAARKPLSELKLSETERNLPSSSASQRDLQPVPKKNEGRYQPFLRSKQKVLPAASQSAIILAMSSRDSSFTTDLS